jgi:hypothetical protein
MNRFWTLNKLVALGVLGAFAMLLLELRFDHRHVLGEHWQSLVPLIYSGAMIIVGGLALWLWDRGGRVLLFWAFSVALVVGVVGFWMHNKGQPVQGVERTLAAWSQPVENEHEHDEHEHDEHGEEAGHESAHDENHHDEPALEEPPVLAPLAFFGLGLLGMLACAGRFQPATENHEIEK